MKLFRKILIELCCGIILLPFLVWSVYYIIPYQVFRFQTSKTISRFDGLNEKVMEELSAPEGVDLIEESNWGIEGNENTFGRLLRLRYTTISGNIEEKLAYYDHKLAMDGWKHKENTHLYFKNTACILVENSTEKRYVVDIWYDFWAQTFSPSPIPASWKIGPFTDDELGIVNFIEFFGKGYVIRCPD